MKGYTDIQLAGQKDKIIKELEKIKFDKLSVLENHFEIDGQQVDEITIGIEEWNNIFNEGVERCIAKVKEL